MRALSPVVGCLLLLFHSQPASAQLRRTNFVTGLTQPVAFVQDPSDSAVQYVVQQTGLVRVIRNGTLLPTAFLDVRSSIASGGERGLLGIAFPSNYATSGRAFVYFNDPNGDIVVARFKRSSGNPLVADPATRVDLRWSTGERVIRHPSFSNHNGGNMAFGPDGDLYIGTGDGGSGNDPNHNAQNMNSLLGKMLRIDVSVADSNAAGLAIPPDNPFPSNGAPEIWDIGLRNPWRWSFDDPLRGGTGALVIADVGQGAWEEVNYEPASRGGNNYGWRNREGAHDNVTSLPPAFQPLVDPIFEYPHPTGFSITGGYVYRGSALGASYRGRYFFGDFVSQKIWSVALTVNPSTGVAAASDLREHTADLTPGGVSAFGVDAQGELYFVDYTNGAIVRITAAPVAPVPAMAVDTPGPGPVAAPFAISGWALDLTSTTSPGVDAIHVWAYPLVAPGGAASGPPVFVGATTLTLDRPDVASVFGGSQFTRSGYVLGGISMPAGNYRLAVFALIHASGTFEIYRLVDVTIASRIFVAVDRPSPGGTVGSTFTVSGWAIDAAVSSGAGIDAVHVWAIPISTPGPAVFLNATTTFTARPDVGAILGSRFTNSGYAVAASGLAPGVWDIYVFARSSGTLQFQAAPPVRITR
jgi:glucose/arabinose dehydrogenase